MAVLKAFEKSRSCFIKMTVSKIILVINPLIIASVIIPKTGNGILVNWKNKIVPKSPMAQPSKHQPVFLALLFQVYLQDHLNVVTHSKIMINLIRKKIGYKNILISDDISMKALKYSLSTNTKKAFKAGCNLVLHCNGNIKEMNKLVKVIPKIDKFTQKKTSHFYKFLG